VTVSPNSELQAATKDNVYVKRNPSVDEDLLGSIKLEGGINVNSFKGRGSLDLSMTSD
jgi:hypothetical protein